MSSKFIENICVRVTETADKPEKYVSLVFV